ncbi:MAG: NAD-dependent epimerase/dehydratase family protein [Propionibacteriaceae bacterium]|jgi:nucleoside-diphosphate-sugar epimerase|nr:NAD-dependent epimerase/dehydratase family protein [Propionibacteriaceae bacterium]
MYPSILFIGGTGTISSACVAEAVSLGYEVTVLNRGRGVGLRPLPAEVRTIVADLEDDEAIRSALSSQSWDSVADFCSFATDRLSRNVDAVKGHTGQYIYISSASAYAKPVPSLPIRDSSPLRNPFWQYSRDKIACEELLTGLYRNEGFPATIVRPSHTYDQTQVVLEGGWTTVDRMRRGLPVVVHGDGTSLWTVTFNTDFAYMFAGLLSNPAAVGEAYTITGDEFLTWDAIFTELAHAAGVESPDLVHVSSDTIARYAPDMGPGLIGDKAHSVVFDCSKVRALRPGFVQKVPFHIGARRVITFLDAHPEARSVKAPVNEAFDRIIAAVRG